MKAKTYRLLRIVFMLALVLLSPVPDAALITVNTHGEADLAAENHGCRLYAAISDDLPDGWLQDHLVDEPNSLKNLAASDNIDGWGIAYYPDYGTTPAIERGAERAYTDTDYDLVVSQIDASEPKITLAHVRYCTTGCCCHGCDTIDCPDPFYRDKNGTRWTFSHNGVLSKDLLLSLIDEDYLAENPPNGSDIPACDPTSLDLVVHSEFYFTLILQHVEENGWNVVNGIAEAVKALVGAGEYGGANFFMSDGSTVWALRRGSSSYYTMYYVHDSGYTAVASQYTSSSQGDWQRIEDYELLILTGDDPPVIIDVRDYPSLLVHPYLGETTTTSVVISWATDNAGASEVRYSLDPSYSNVVAATNNTYDGKYWHSATITGLTAGTTYYYKVYTSGYDVTPWSEITFTITPLNDAPVAADDETTTDENAPVDINVLLNDSDPDGDTLTVSDYDTFSTEGGTVSCTSTGVCTYTPPTDFNGTDTFTYTASDDNGGADTAIVTVTVIAVALLENLIYLPLIWKD